MRRILIFGLVLSLMGVGPAPLSACALMSSKPAECAMPQTRSLCEGMASKACGFHFAATSDASCCLTQAPLPASKYEAPGLAFTAELSGVRLQIDLAHVVQHILPAPEFRDTSPPDLQSSLCTFLI